VFRVNVDGDPGIQFSGVEIAPKDSLFIFVEATLDPNGSDDILRIQDSVVFMTNGNLQDIDLVAWGQDVHMIGELEIEVPTTWVADKPYLIIDYVYVDSVASLTIGPGVKVHLHKDAIIYVDGSLQANGTRDEPIWFGGDRLEEAKRERARRRRDALATSIYEAGHHTTFQHAHFQFALNNVSRQFIWSFLHSHPFYNSEQVSQRYVTVKPGNYAVPPLAAEPLAIYQKTVDAQQEAYEDLCKLLFSPTAEAYYGRYPSRRRLADKYDREVRKKAQEVARYVLPVATFAYMYHTVSGITLLRYYRACEQFDAPLEQRLVVGAMVRELLKLDPSYAAVLEEPIPADELPEADVMRRTASDERERRAFLDRFDDEMGDRVSLLIDYPARNEESLAAAVREVLGCGPGRVVGQALRHLTDRVVEDPARNTPEQLRALLERWAAERAG